MTQYLNSKFSVYSPGTREYADNWDRIFGKRDLAATILARARGFEARHNQVVFWPVNFADLGSEVEVLIALDVLVAENKMINEYTLLCADGHTIGAATEPPSCNCHCAVCGLYVNLADEFSFCVERRFVLRR